MDRSEACSQMVTTGIGIPCAHKIEEKLNRNEVLDPNDFHLQWHPKYNPEITRCEPPEMDLDGELKMLMVALSQEKPKKAMELIGQIKSMITGTHIVVAVQPPNVKTNTKGRPSAKKGRLTSTQRNQSALEIVNERLENETKAKKQAMKASGRKNQKQAKKTASEDPENLESDAEELLHEYSKEGKAIEFQESDAESVAESVDGNVIIDSCIVSSVEGGKNVVVETPYITQIHENMKEFIQDVFDPTGNGNCGYHCVAKALGYKEDSWFRVRKEMLDEAKEHKRVYSRLQGGEGGFKLMIKALEVESKDTKIKETQWLLKIAHGQLIANTYQ
ncbi:hypothetical protein PCANC_27287 [Puccinia coronata f. sp. avenae]|uniref:OTU domain-containing protein n=1 Tax=Puccinia coronata f. sp. avenae TaxID=200324 RepID=A0A2N5S2I2_9BASI|nr:hypothetical protein PCANC_27287 [Puccinia coronata f. sp. avenae]